MMTNHAIEFKVKSFDVRDGDTVRTAITWKKKLTRTDCTLRPQDHTYFNSDLFLSILNRVYRRVIGEYSEFSYIDELPQGVTVDTSKFLVVVRIELAPNFR